MTVNDWAAFILAAIGIATALFKGLQALIRKEMFDVKHELTNNSGSSVKDKVDSTVQRLERVENRVDEIYSILIERH